MSIKKKTSIAILCALFFYFSTFIYNKYLYQPKIFDCFMFFNEFDILDIRLRELYDKVDKFVIVESSLGFSKKPKPLYFAENKERYAKFSDKIVHVAIDRFPPFPEVGKEDYWHIENFQRNQIMQGLQRCKPHPRDIILITDVDEIIRDRKISRIKNLIDKKGVDVVFGQFLFFKFFLNRELPMTWDIAISTSYKNLSKYLGSVQALRNLSGFSKGHPLDGFDVLSDCSLA